MLDTEYLEKYYKTAGAQEYSMQDLQLESMADPETVPFESRSIDMRVLTGQTSVFYTVSHPNTQSSQCWEADSHVKEPLLLCTQ